MKQRLVMTAVLGLALMRIGYAAPMGEILEFGYYEVQVEGERYQDPNSTSGAVVAAPTVKLLQQTDIIPIEPGRMFGFRFRLSGFPAGKEVEIREIVVHPTITKPDKTKSTGFESRLALNVQRGEVVDYAGYRMDHDYEMVAGEWRFEFWLDNRKLLEKKFTTVKTAESKPPAAQSAAPSRRATAR